MKTIWKRKPELEKELLKLKKAQGRNVDIPRLSETLSEIAKEKINERQISIKLRLLKKDIPEEEKTPLSEEEKEKLLSEIIIFLNNFHTLDEIAEEFKIEGEIVRELLQRLPEEYSLVRYENLVGDIYARIFPTGKKVRQPREWNYILASQKKPGLVIIFPETWDYKKLKIIPLSDVLFGNKSLCDEKRFDERLKMIQTDPLAFILLNGDIFDNCVCKNYELFENCISKMRDKLLPLAHKILWAQRGCKEERILKSKNVGLDPLEIICKELDIPYFEVPLHAVIEWKKKIFSFYCVHGRSVAQKKGSKLNAALRPAEFLEHTHFIIMSHIKDSISKSVTKIIRDRRRFDLVEKKQFVLTCPSFINYYTSEEAKKGYAPPSKSPVQCVLYADGTIQLPRFQSMEII